MSIEPNTTTGRKMEQPVSLRQQQAYALPTIATTFLFSPILILQGVYVKYFGVGLETMASVVFIARLFDAVSDPVIGYCSDRYYARTNSRKPFVVVGALLMTVCAYFL